MSNSKFIKPVDIPFIPNFSSEECIAVLSINSGVLPNKSSDALIVFPSLGLQQCIGNIIFPVLKGKKATPYPYNDDLPSESTFHTSNRNLGHPLIVRQAIFANIG
jgi:hypothetical protein